MKTALLLLSGVLIVAGVAWMGCAEVDREPRSDYPPITVGSRFSIGSTPESETSLMNLPFRVARVELAPRDAIIILEVFASSRRLKAGDTIVVRGFYQLASKADAMLGLFQNGSGRTAESPLQRLSIAQGTGEFELSGTLIGAGALHVSFYPSRGESSFGGVYFAPAR